LINATQISFYSTLVYQPINPQFPPNNFVARGLYLVKGFHSQLLFPVREQLVIPYRWSSAILYPSG